MKVVSVALIAFSLAASPLEAATVVVIKDSPGGRVVDFDAQAKRWAKLKAIVVIDGRCASSCTRYTFPKWGLNLCATPQARLMFHKPWRMDPKDHSKPVTTPAAQREMDVAWKLDWLAYWNAKQRAYFAGKHVPSTSRGEDGMIKLEGPDTALFAKPCPQALIRLTKTGPVVIVNDNG